MYFISESFPSTTRNSNLMYFHEKGNSNSMKKSNAHNRLFTQMLISKSACLLEERVFAKHN